MGNGRADLVTLNSNGTLSVLPNTGGAPWVSVPPRSGAPAFALRVAPVPSRGSVAIGFTLPDRAPVMVRVHDVGGRAVATVAAGWFAAGPHEIRWDGRAADGASAPPGVYVIELRAGSGRAARKLAVVR